MSVNFEKKKTGEKNVLFHKSKLKARGYDIASYVKIMFY